MFNRGPTLADKNLRVEDDMHKLLIHSQGQVEHGEQIKNFFETRLPYEVGISFDRKMTQDLIGQRAIHLLLFETQKFNELDLQMLKDLRGVGFSYPILIVSDTIEIAHFSSMAEKLKMHNLEKPFEYRALRGITQKLVLARNVPQQRHRRFKTEQQTSVETYNSGEVIPTHMFNLSIGGAYFEFGGQPRVTVGDLVRVKVQLSDLLREHSMNARVVWTTRRTNSGPGNGVGVRFLKGQDVYRQLLDKV
jgi:hypothetical protein